MVSITPKGVKAWVTFSFKPHDDVESVSIAGDWNGWEEEEMKRKKDGTFYLRKYLLMGQNYEFRYRINHKEWVNDPNTPHVNNPYGTQNSLLELEGEIETSEK